MTEGLVLDLGREALMTAIYISGPMLVLAIAVGLLVSLFQATTQIQEQTLTFVPKILAIIGAMIVFGPWMLRRLMDFSIEIFANLHRLVG